MEDVGNPTTTPAAPAKAVSVGKIEKHRYSTPTQESQQDTVLMPPGNLPVETNGTTSEPLQTEAPKFTDEQVAEYLKSKNIKFDGNWDNLKAKSEYEPPTAEPTAEEKAAKAQAFEKRMVDLWIETGGKIEQFADIKKYANADVAELSKSELIAELKKEGFTDEEIPEVIKNRYFQKSLDEIEQAEDETEEEFKKRKVFLEKEIAYGAKKLANRSQYLKKQAEKILNGFKAEIEAEETQAMEDAKFSTTVDEHFRTMPRKQTFELGETAEGGLKILPVEHEVSQTSIDKAHAILKDPQAFKQYLYNKDGSLNFKVVSDLLVNNFDREEALRKTYSEAITRNTRHVEETFGFKSPQGLGVGGAPQKNGTSGRATKAGQIERVRPQYS